MATGLAVPRSAASTGPVRVPNLPVIEHPMARLGDKADLSVRGSSSSSMRRENTMATVHHGKLDMGVRGHTTMSSQDLRKSTPDRILQWPPVVDHNVPFPYKTMKYDTLPPINVNAEPKGQDKVKGQIPNQVDKFPQICQIPKVAALPPLPTIDEQEEYLRGPPRSKYRTKEQILQPRNTDELKEMIREKLATGHYGIRHLFRSNDPSGHGKVSREAFQRILFTLCGYMSPDQYSRLLRSTNLDDKPTITFDMFTAHFKDPESSRTDKEWMSPIQGIGIADTPRYPEENLKSESMLVHDPYTSMPFSDAIFKEKCKSRNFDAKRVFPLSVFKPGGLIVPPQLREAYAQLGIFMLDLDFQKLWQRYDKEGTGAIPAAQFFHAMGLDKSGKPRVTSSFTPRGAAYSRARLRPHSDIAHSTEGSANIKKLLERERIATAAAVMKQGETAKDTPKPDLQKEKGEVKKDKQEKMEEDKDAKENKNSVESENKLKAMKTKLPKKQVKLDNIIDCLHYKFEESYNAMLTAFQLFDFLNDSYISKVDFRRVLQEFGFCISPTELDHFLSRAGIRSIKGQINYKEFLTKYQSKADNSITAKIAVTDSHPFWGGVIPQDNVNAEELEARLVDYFHGDFVKLVAHFRACDKYGLGVITAHEFRSGIERCLGYQMSETQWEQLKEDVGQDRDGLIPFPKFLQIFDITPGAWNKKQEGWIQASQVTKAEMPVPEVVERLRERAKTEMVPKHLETQPMDGTRSLAEIKHDLDEVFKNKFHTFDKHFKEMDRRQMGRMSKWQFGALLKMTGLTLTPNELDRIWATLNIATDGMYSYSTLIQHFINYKVPEESKEPFVFEDTSELVETARKVQRERKEQREKEMEWAKTGAMIPVTLGGEMAKENATKTEKPLSPAPPTPYQPPPSRALSRASSIQSVPPSRASLSSVQSVRTKSLLVKIRDDVISNWEGLKSVFKYVDKQGQATITMAEMLDIMKSMNFSLDDEEMRELCKRFDLHKDGRFGYLAFMKCYARRQENQARSKPLIYSKYTHKLEQQQQRGRELQSVTVQNVIDDFRIKLMKEHKNLRRAFKKIDKANRGYISVFDFKKALRHCKINFTNEDFYYIMSEFDHNLDGKITYDEFLGTLLTV